MLAGVAGGLADYFDIDPTLVRLTWAIGALVTGPVALVLYLLCALIIPASQKHASSKLNFSGSSKVGRLDCTHGPD